MFLASAMAVAIAATVPAPSLAGPTRATRCDTFGGRTVTATQQARVFIRAGSLRGCVNARRRSVPIPYAYTCQFGTCGLARLVLAGRNVTFAVDPTADPRRGQPSPSVFVIDLTTGRNVRRAAAAPTTIEPVTYDTCTDGQRGDGRCAPAPRVGAMFLSPRGAVAWTLEVAYVGSTRPPLRAVRKLDAAGPGTLAEGGAIDVASLAGRNSRIFWQDAGQPMSAVLEEPR